MQSPEGAQKTLQRSGVGVQTSTTDQDYTMDEADLLCLPESIGLIMADIDAFMDSVLAFQRSPCGLSPVGLPVNT